MTGWQWDPSLYAGSGGYYAHGRVAYPPELVSGLVARLGLDGRGRLLDLGCGPGSLTLLLAPHVAAAVGLDPDPGMLAEGARRAASFGMANVAWVQRRAESVGPDLGRFRLATLAQSFHWTDRPRVARLLHAVLDDDGALVHVHATTHEGVDGREPLAHPRPPRGAIETLVASYLGPRRRAGQGVRTGVETGEDELGRVESAIYRAAGFLGPDRLEVPGQVVTRTADQVVASVFSLSYAAPHLFDERAGEFEADLRALLAAVAADGVFSEQMREIVVDVWRVSPSR